MKIYKGILATLMLVATANTSNASEFHPLPTQESRDTTLLVLKSELASAKNRHDSIAILYNIYDVANRTEKNKVISQLYDVAQRDNRHDVQLDALRLKANLNISNDSVLRSLLKETRQLPDSPDQRETLAFINICMARYANNHFTEAERIKYISEAINKYKRHIPADKYQEIQLLNEIAIYLTNSASSNTLNTYLDKALALTDSISSESNALRNSTLTSMATLNIRNLDAERTIKANNDMLDLVNELETHYRSQGRKYKEYNTVKFVSLRRILSQYKALDIKTVDSIYNVIQEIALRDRDVRRTMDKYQAVEAYYKLAHGDYAAAIPMLKKSYSENNESYLNIFYLSNILEAANKIGDKATLLEYSPLYIKILEESNRLQSESKYHELEMLYDFNSLKAQNLKLRDNYESEREDYHKRIVTIAYIVIPLLVVLLGWLFFMFMRKRKITQQLELSNKRLTNESEKLISAQKQLIVARDNAKKAEKIKTDFINNMTHEFGAPLDAIAEYSQLIVDCVDESKQKYLQRYAEIVKKNVDLVSTLIKDILDIGELENAKLKANRRPCSLQDIVDAAVGTVERHINPGVELILPRNLDDDILIVSDKYRVEQVLINLLQNAAKFTRKGSITLDYTLQDNGNSLLFTITDTGIGIPAGKSKKIFEKFEKIDPQSQGSGLGLTICAIVAKLLGGKVWAEDNRKHGARFYFKIPIKSSVKP